MLYVFGAGHGAVEFLESYHDLSTEGKMGNQDIKCVVDDPAEDYLEVVYRKYWGTKMVAKYPIIDFKKFEKSLGHDKHFGFISCWNVDFKKRISKEYKELIFPTFIHEFADVLCDDFGSGNWFGYGVHAASNLKVGNFIRFNFGAKLTYGCEIGDYSFVGINSVLCGNVKVGEGCFINSNCVVINKNLKIGDGAVVGAGSVVTKNVKRDEIVYGIPAKHKGFVNDILAGSEVKEND